MIIVPKKTSSNSQIKAQKNKLKSSNLNQVVDIAALEPSQVQNESTASKLTRNNFGFNQGVNVVNQTNLLREVIVHRPGLEIERLVNKLTTISNFEGNLHLERAQREHDLFVNILKKRGVKVYYLEKMVAEALEFAGPLVKDQFIKRFVSEAKIQSVSVYQTCVNYFRSFNSGIDMVNAMIAGVKISEVPPIEQNRFSDILLSSNPFLITPLPKFLFQRELFHVLGNGISLFKSGNHQGQRASLFYEYLIKFHPRFDNLNLYFNRDFENCEISGNDVVLLNDTNLLIGISEQTDVVAIETLARNVFNDRKNSIKRIVAINVHTYQLSEASRSLSQMFNVVDRDKFIIDESVLNVSEIFEITSSIEKDIDGINKLNFKQLELSFSEVIELLINKRPKFVICGGGDEIRSERERNYYGINTLTIAPGEIVAYDRNHYTNQLLINLGVTIHTIPSAELSRAPGGPFNMICPLWRE